MSRILLVTNIFPPLIGGPATFIDRLAHDLSHKGHKVTVVCSSPSRSHPSDEERPFRVCRVSIANRYVYEVQVRLVLAREMATHGLIFVNGLESYVGDVNRILRKQYILKVVGDPVWERARNLGATALDIDEFQKDEAARRPFATEMRQRTAALAGARHVVVPSEYLKQLVSGWGVPEDQISVVPNGVEEGFLDTPAPRRRESERMRALFVGRLTNWKGVETLLLAAQGLPNVDIAIAGDGPEYPNMVELARQLRVTDRVDFLGRMPRERIREEMRRSHSLVLTSLYEGHPHVLLEAGSSGLARVASTRGGNREVIHDEQDGLLVPPQDVGALQTALARLSEDEPLRHRLATHAWEKRRGHRLGQSVEQIVDLMECHGY